MISSLRDLRTHCPLGAHAVHPRAHASRTRLCPHGRLLGVDSTLPWNVAGYPRDEAVWQRNRLERLAIWERLASDLPLEKLRLIHSATVGLSEVGDLAEPILRGEVRGRVVVDVDN